MSTTTTTKTQATKPRDLARRKDMFEIPLNHVLVRDGFNARDFSTEANQEHVEKLARQIAEQGQLNPISVFFDKSQSKFIVIDGESRYRALSLLQSRLRESGKSDEADAIVIKAMNHRQSSSENQMIMMLQANEGRPLDASEKAKAVKKMVDVFGWTVNEVAQKTGWKAHKVRQLLTFSEFPKSVFQMVANGEVAFNTALKALKEVEGNYDKAAELLSTQKQEKAEAIIEEATKVVEAREAAGEITEEESSKIIENATKKAKEVKVTSKDVSNETSEPKTETPKPVGTGSNSLENTLDSFIESLETVETEAAMKLANVLTMLKDVDAGNAKESDLMDYVRKNF